jgi:hypothetical protein
MGSYDDPFASHACHSQKVDVVVCHLRQTLKTKISELSRSSASLLSFSVRASPGSQVPFFGNCGQLKEYLSKRIEDNQLEFKRISYSSTLIASFRDNTLIQRPDFISESWFIGQC